MFRPFPSFTPVPVAGASFEMSIFGMLDGVPDPLPTLIDEEDLLFGGEKSLLGVLGLMSLKVELCSVLLLWDGVRFPYSSQYHIIRTRY